MTSSGYQSLFERIRPYFPRSRGASRADDRRIVSAITGRRTQKHSSLTKATTVILSERRLEKRKRG